MVLRFATRIWAIRANRFAEKTLFHKMRAIRANRLKPAIRNFLPSRSAIRKKRGVQFARIRRFSVTFLAGHGEICPPAHMGDPHGDPQTSPQHAIHMDFLHGSLLKATKSMWIGVLWAGLRVAICGSPMWGGANFAMAC